MPTLEALLVLSMAGLAGIGIVGGFAAWAWAAWLRLRAHEITHALDHADDLPAIGHRIELADLKERVRKLEAIAAGVDF